MNRDVGGHLREAVGVLLLGQVQALQGGHDVSQLIDVARLHPNAEKVGAPWTVTRLLRLMIFDFQRQASVTSSNFSKFLTSNFELCITLTTLNPKQSFSSINLDSAKTVWAMASSPQHATSHTIRPTYCCTALYRV